MRDRTDRTAEIAVAMPPEEFQQLLDKQSEYNLALLVGKSACPSTASPRPHVYRRHKDYRVHPYVRQPSPPLDSNQYHTLLEQRAAYTKLILVARASYKPLDSNQYNILIQQRAEYTKLLVAATSATSAQQVPSDSYDYDSQDEVFDFLTGRNSKKQKRYRTKRKGPPCTPAQLRKKPESLHMRSDKT